MEPILVLVYRIRTKTIKPNSWYIALNQGQVDADVADVQDESGEWYAEVIEAKLTDGIARALAGKVAGTQTSDAKRAAARENGKKGGRPKKVKPND